MNAPAPTLKDRITDDMKSAMRARETLRLGAIRMLLAAVKQREVDERIILDDAQVAAIVDKLIKQRRDSIAQFEQAGRTDLVDQEKAEMPRKSNRCWQRRSPPPVPQVRRTWARSWRFSRANSPDVPTLRRSRRWSRAGLLRARLPG
jgi:hypothetical protein